MLPWASARNILIAEDNPHKGAMGGGREEIYGGEAGEGDEEAKL